MITANKVILIGFVGPNPTSHILANGSEVLKLKVATAETNLNKATSTPIRNIEWHTIIFHGKLSQTLKQNLREGALVFVEGQLKSRVRKTEGNISQHFVEIESNNIQPLDSNLSESEVADLKEGTAAEMLESISDDEEDWRGVPF
ncbi:single-strand binding protein [Candidatus Tremblaya phenacola PAVE]|nr:single-strand binding protein [Candidatus Tremblaya phenacola PAVE]